MALLNLDISKRASLYMKGAAILIISLHNIIHKLPKMPLENEFSYSSSGANLFFSNAFFNEPFYFISSFLGHYGVQIFIFLSAYAFYLKKESILNFSKFKFYKQRYIRILYPVVISIVVVSVLNVALRLLLHDSVSTKTIINSFLGSYIGGALHLLAIHPFLPENTPGGIGPWWFISFIIQFYILLPFLLKIEYTKIKCLFLILMSIAFNFVVTKYELLGFDVFYTVLGHFPEIIFAFYYVKYLKHKKIHVVILLAVFVIATLLMLYCNSNVYAWYFAIIPSTITFLALLLLVQKLSNKKIAGFFILIGKISIYVFLLNGMTREFFIPAIKTSNVSTSAALIVAYLILTILLSYALYTLENFIKVKINQKK